MSRFHSGRGGSSNGFQGNSNDATSTLRVRGWKESKASSNPDQGIRSLVGFLEKKASPPQGQSLTISRHHIEGDTLFITVRSDSSSRFLHLNGFSFAGSTLIVEEDVSSPNQPNPQSNGLFSRTSRPQDSGRGGNAFNQSGPRGPAPRGPSNQAPQTSQIKSTMIAVIRKRYNPSTKVLDLSALEMDPDLQSINLFQSSKEKWFSALMTMCEDIWESPAKKREMVPSVTLNNNNLNEVLDVISLANAFPDLKNLDLSNNQIKDTGGLRYWRRKFRDLEHLILSSNPIDSQPNIADVMKSWYPKLTIYNQTNVRSRTETSQSGGPPPTRGARFHDSNRVAEGFMREFIPLFDTNRELAIKQFYDDGSTYSLSVKTRGKQVRGRQATDWSEYIKRSRNLVKLRGRTARAARLFQGQAAIFEQWSHYPQTQHPSFDEHASEWLLECGPVSNLPDPTGVSSIGVEGLMITAHGVFEDLNKEGKISKRSFDRIMVIGPGTGPSGVRVISDILVLRPYSGNFASIAAIRPASPAGTPAQIPAIGNNINGPVIPFILNGAPTVTPSPTPIHQLQQPPTQQQQAPSQPILHPEVPPNSTYGVPAPGKSEADLLKEQLRLKLSFQTKLTLHWSELCLSGNNWNLEAAYANFMQLNGAGQIPGEAFLQGV